MPTIMYINFHTDYFSGLDMRQRTTSRSLPLPVQRVLRALGQDIRDARLRRRIPTAIMAERASISRTTLNKVEKGDPGVSLGIYATVLFVLGLSDRLSNLADIRSDTVGLELDEERLPQRIRRSRKTKHGSSKKRGAE